MQLLQESRRRSLIGFPPAKAANNLESEKTMGDESAGSAVGRRRLQELLLGYLWAKGAPSWPGADGLTVQEVLCSYPENAAAGRVPDQQQLERLYPDLREEVVSFFADDNGHRE
jgi:hypothetical protein